MSLDTFSGFDIGFEIDAMGTQELVELLDQAPDRGQIQVVLAAQRKQIANPGVPGPRVVGALSDVDVLGVGGVLASGIDTRVRSNSPP